MEEYQINDILKKYPFIDREDLEIFLKESSEEELKLLPEILENMPLINDMELNELSDFEDNEELKLQVSSEEAKQIEEKKRKILDNWKIENED